MDANEKPNPAELKVFWRRLGPFMRAERMRYAIGSSFEILTLGTTLAFPQLIRIIVDQGIKAGEMDRINQLVLFMAAILLVGAFASFIRTYLFELAALRASVAIQQWVFGRLIIQEIGFFDKENAGEISGRIGNDVSRLTFALANVVPEAIHFSLMGLVAGGLMLYSSPTLSLIVALVAPLIWAGTNYAGKILRRLSAVYQTEFASINVVGLEALSTIQTVRVYRQEEAELARYRHFALRMIAAARHQARAHGMLRSFTDLVSEGAVVLAIWVGGTLIVGGSLTEGSLISFILYAAMVMRSFRNASQIVSGMMTAQGASERIFELGEREPLIANEGGEIPDADTGHIRFENVSFVYPTRPDAAALRGVDLEIPRGEVLAIVGASGSGKSTIAKLIARLYDPDQGRILLDGMDLREIDPEYLRGEITLVPAEAALFARSVADNIRFGRPEAPDEDVKNAMQIANAEGFIGELPDQLETDAGDRGQLFSSGQRQRIGIARAVVRRPKILILDEATAAIDAEGEAEIKDALRKISYRPTIIIVSHRLSTIVDADRVVLVKDGVVHAMGTHDELLKSSVEYRALVDTQLIGDRGAESGAA
jgi:ATP-binding cassette subfamily B protein